MRGIAIRLGWPALHIVWQQLPDEQGQPVVEQAERSRRGEVRAEAAEPAGARGLGWLVLAIALAPVSLRLLLMRAEGVSPLVVDLRGFAADTAVGTAAAIVACSVVRLPGARFFLAALGALWAVVHYANYEHVVTLGALVGLAYAGYLADPTFLLGSALSPSEPVIAGALVVASAVFAWFAAPWRPSTRVMTIVLTLSVIAFTIVGLWPFDDDAGRWRQTNFISENAAWLLTPSVGRSPEPSLTRAPPDLSGESILEIGSPRAKNVLLIMLEGISGAHLPSIAAAHSRTAPTVLSRLDSRAQSALRYTHFFDLQRQTNRGEYAILCGDYPKLLTAAPKMSELAGTGALSCLPAALRDAGYQTAYLQAAPLAFMLKDQFMIQAGYDRVHGDEWFAHYYERNQWGIDDRAYFEQSLEMVGELERADRPWFLTMLTVGTHHPFNVPRQFKGTAPPDSFPWAVEYLDDALDGFLRALASRGVLENTLVIITSDESSGLQGDVDDLTKLRTQGWGVLVVLEPSGTASAIDDRFSQLDVPLSVLDYLAMDSHGFGGRSIFRRYAKPRWIVWGNTYLRAVGGIAPTGEILACPESFRRCRAFRAADGKLFGPNLTSIVVDRGHTEHMLRIAQQSLVSTIRSGPRTFELIVERRQPLIRTPSKQFVFGGQFFAAPAQARVDVDISVELRGGRGSALITHDLVSRGGGVHYGRRGQILRKGETATIRYSVTLAKAVDRIECRFWVNQSRGKSLELYFHEADIRIRPPDRSGGRPGTIEREFKIEVQ